MRSASATRVRRAPSLGAARDAERTAAALLALQLLGRWQRACNGHLAFSSGCACGLGASVDLRDCDDLILDYLSRKFARTPAVTAFIAAHAAGTSGTLKALLAAIGSASAALPARTAEDLLSAIETSIASIEEQHAM